MTPARNSTWRYICKYQADNGYTPTYREIAEAMGLRSLASAFKRIKGLEADGMLTLERPEKGRHMARPIRLLLVPADDGLRLDEALQLAGEGGSVRISAEDGSGMMTVGPECLFSRADVLRMGWESVPREVVEA